MTRSCSGDCTSGDCTSGDCGSGDCGSGDCGSGDCTSGGGADREAAPVELVDPDGRTVGSSTVDIAHRAPGLLHRAFSVVLVNPAGRLLLQRRAAVKTRFALRWANACCGHPAPGEAVTDAASRRLAEELGVDRVALTEVGVYRYRASDPASGRVEHEYDHVLAGTVPARPALAPDPAEVADLRWVDPVRLAADLRADLPVDLRTDLRTDLRGGSGNGSAGTADERYAPWLSGVLATWLATPPATRLAAGAPPEAAG